MQENGQTLGMQVYTRVTTTHTTARNVRMARCFPVPASGPVPLPGRGGGGTTVIIAKRPSVLTRQVSGFPQGRTLASRQNVFERSLPKR